MAALIAPGIARYSINATFSSNPVANVLDYFIDTTGSTANREDAVAKQASIILNEWCDHILPLLVNEYNFTSVSWVDLDDEDGSTGSATDGEGEVLPQTGSITTDPASPNVAALITKTAPGGGRATRNGRMYLCGIAEADVAASGLNLSSTFVATLNAALGDFQTGTDGSHDISVGVPYEASLRVVHTRNAGTVESPNIVFTGSNDVTDLAVQTLLATQRRRLRR